MKSNLTAPTNSGEPAAGWLKKYSVPIATYAIFTLIGLIVWAIRDVRYFALFNGIGTTELVTRILVINNPRLRQPMRRLVQALVGGMLLIMLGFVFGVNFQFAKAIYNYRRLHVRIDNLDQLRSLPELSAEDIVRLAPYLSFE